MGVTSLEDVSVPPLGRAVRRVGPAFVLAAATIGPGTITVYTIAGALFGYELLWVFPVAGLFAVVYVEMLARFGIVSEATLWGAVREKFDGVREGLGDVGAGLGGLFGVATAVGFQTSNTIGVGIGLELLTGVDAAVWATLGVALTVAFVWVRDLYRRLEALVLVLVGVMLAAFLGTLSLTGVDAGGAAAGLVPAVPSADAAFLTLAMMATYFSLYGVVYQSYLVDEKGYGREDLGIALFDSVAAMVILGLLGAVVLLTSAVVLSPADLGGDPVAGMAEQLRPLAGDAAYVLFGVGLFGASFTSLVANSLIGGTLFADALDYSAAFDDRPVKVVATGVTLLGWFAGVVPQFFGSDPVSTIVLAQAFSVVGLPYFGFVALLLLNDPDYVGEFTNTTARNVIAVVGYLVTIGIALNFLRRLV